MGVIDTSALKAARPISSVIGASVKLKRAGREFVGCCPFHPDRNPSFYVNDDKAHAWCMACGWDGDVIDFLKKSSGVGFREAAAQLSSGNVPMVVAATLPPEPDRDTRAEALAIWRSAVSVSGTAAEAYLRARGINCRIPESLRFARLKYGKRGPQRPALVALVASVDNRAIGIQRTYLNAGGTGKAKVAKPKLALGGIRGGAIRLAPAAAELIVTGGIEDGLALQQERGAAVWVAAGEGNMAKMLLPEGTRSVVIGADRDERGEEHAERAAEAFAEQGRSVRIIRPMPGFKDFNDELRGVAT
ncbi:DUF7146 domain-containing protein [Sphingosinicella rhizophila]|uniref:CHC2 zinc finger domain-containing protein n=1 Tax=Sphingosinicella rhizophila TaxID=3050082 RepID=A0ABU3Q531_9SPHN|nr:CHC2 zinc finger domain-containing protein [Sphingosinicella sp. GR2756]MDT9598522.1 CHC2 zinc finger domain-containing protein [Sphingosinicella sp. GR2756]